MLREAKPQLAASSTTESSRKNKDGTRSGSGGRRKSRRSRNRHQRNMDIIMRQEEDFAQHFCGESG